MRLTNILSVFITAAATVFITATIQVAAHAQPALIDINSTSLNTGGLQRILGSTGTGTFGVPVAGGFDMDGDSHVDYAIGFMTASPSGQTRAGEINLIFGNGLIQGEIDTAIDQERVLRIFGSQSFETAGSEIWMDDVTGDNIGDLLICRQNFTPSAGRSGAGALTIIAGGPELRGFAQGLQPLMLGSAPPAGLKVTHIVGAAAGDRLCVWARTGDVTGDGIAETVVGADQRNAGGGTHSGAVYVLLGGSHLAAGGTLDLINLSAAALQGKVAHLTAPPVSSHYHLGATVQIADLDGNGTAEVLAAATLNRAGASLSPQGGPTAHGSGGAVDGILYILWDDNFTPPWPGTLEFSVLSPPGSRTQIRGAARNVNFGEEILGGLDYDGEGNPDLFVGDLVGDGTLTGNRPVSGFGNVFYQAASLKGLEFNMDAPPPSVLFSTLLGPINGAIGADTAAHGDFDNDGIDDLAFCSPRAAPLSRTNAGAVHVLRGRVGGWPDWIDTAALPSSDLVEITEIQGARGSVGGDSGDTLCYSAAAGDVDGDGSPDLLINEMLGNGSAANDVGNLLVMRGKTIFLSIFTDGFESGNVSAWSSSLP